MNYLAPSMLSADFSKLGEQLRILDEAGASHVHLDVMDGSYVPSISFGQPVIRALRPLTSRIFDVHLMIDEPVRYIKEFADAGADLISVHPESCIHLDRTVMAIKEEGKLAAVALNPATDLSVLDYILPKLDMVLIMTVNPGFGGQKFIDYTLDKVKDLKKLVDRRGLSTDIQVDGGVNLDNVEILLEAGANVIVSGSALFAGDLRGNVGKFLEKMGVK